MASQDLPDVLAVQESDTFKLSTKSATRTGLPAHERRLFIFRGYQDAASASGSFKSVASSGPWRESLRTALKERSLAKAIQLLRNLDSQEFIHIPVTDWKTLLRAINDKPYWLFSKDDIAVCRRILVSFTDNVYSLIEQPGRVLTESLMQALAHLRSPHTATEVFTSWYGVKGREALRSADLVRELLDQREWAVISTITDDAIRTFADLNAFVVETRMLALAQISQPALAVEAFKWFKESSTPPSRQALTILFRCHLANHDVVAADQALDCLAKTGWNSGQPFVQAMLKGYRSLGFDGKLERRVLEEIAAGKLRYATSIINSLVQLRLDSDDIQGASALMRYIQLPDQVATEHGDSSDVSISFPKPKADVATFTILINMACRSDRLRLEQLEAIWRELLAACDSKDRLDGPSLRALVRGLVICGRPDEATSVLADIIGGRVNRWHTGQPRLSAQVFNALLRHRAVEEGLEGALDVLRMMAEAHVLPDSTTIRLLVTSFGWQAQAKPAAMAKLTGRLLKEIPSLKPDGQLLDILLQQAVAEETRRTHSQVDKDNQKARSATESSASGVIRDLVFPPCDQADQASDQNLPRFDPVAGIIVGADLESHYEPLFKTAVEVGAKSSAQAFVSRLALDKDRGTKPAPTAGDIYAIMLERGIKPSAAHFLQLMQGFVHGHKPEKAEDVFIMAAKVGIEPTISMWCVLIWGYGQAGDLAASFAALERMKRLGLEPNQFVYTSIGSAMLRRHEYRRADAFIRACWPRTEVVDSAFLEVAFHAKMRSGQYRQGVELLRAHAHIHWDRTLRDTIARTIKSHSKRQNGRATERELRAVLQSSSRPSKTIPLKFRDWSKPLAEALRMAVRSARNYGRIEEEGSCGGTDGTKGTKMKPTLH